MALPDDAPSYRYDDSPLGNRPTSPYDTQPEAGAERPAAPKRPRWPQDRPRRSSRFSWSKVHPARRVGDALIFLTGADKKWVSTVGERIRYHTIAVLMLLTAGQAWYSASLFMSVSLGKPLRDELGFGLFFAAAVLFIDRSIISGASKFKVNKVTGELAAPKKFTPVLIIRIGIAVAAALLMSEMILLQVFAADINEKVQSDQLAATTAADNTIQANYQAQIAKLQAQITTAQQAVYHEQGTVNRDYAAMNCQEFGCPAQGITPGLGPGYDAARTIWRSAQQLLADDRQNLKGVTKTVQPKIDADNADLQNAIKGAQPAISHANKILSQEEAFWQLTVANGSVAATRLLLSLLILGIDLAPILTKLTGRASDHDVMAHQTAYDAFDQIRQNARTTLHKRTTRAAADRQLHDLGLGTELLAAQQQAEVSRAGTRANAQVALFDIKLGASLRRHRAQQAFMVAKAAPPPRSPADQGGGRNAYPTWSRGGNPHGSPNGNDNRYGRARGNGNRNGDSDGDDAAGGSGAEPLVGIVPSVFAAPTPPMAPETGHDHYSAWTIPEQVPASEPEPELVDSTFEELSYPDSEAEDDLNDPDPAWASDQIDEQAGILWDAGRDDSPEALVLDHRWALLHRLPGADPGGGGIVWEARELNDPTQAPYVVKTVSGDQVDRRTTDIIQQLHNLRHEQRAAGLTGAGGPASEHIGEIIAQGDDRGFYYLVYPLYRPGSLARHCDRLGPRQTLRWSARVVYEVLSALVAASDEGLVHLDIKPGNIVLDGERARVIDWGLSRVWTASPQSTWRPQGSPFYACPEVVLHPSVAPNSPLADLYSVGATFYWLLTGEAPLERDSPSSQDYQAYRELLDRGRPPRPVRELVGGIPRPVSDLIDRWLSFDPAQRVPAGTPPGDVTRVARDELAVLLPALPETTVGRVTARRRWGRRLP